MFRGKSWDDPIFLWVFLDDPIGWMVSQKTMLIDYYMVLDKVERISSAYAKRETFRVVVLLTQPEDLSERVVPLVTFRLTLHPFFVSFAVQDNTPTI